MVARGLAPKLTNRPRSLRYGVGLRLAVNDAPNDAPVLLLATGTVEEYEGRLDDDLGRKYTEPGFALLIPMLVPVLALPALAVLSKELRKEVPGLTEQSVATAVEEKLAKNLAGVNAG